MSINVPFDLQSDSVTNLLRNAQIFAVAYTVTAIRTTDETLDAGKFNDSGVYYDHSAETYMLRLYDEEGNQISTQAVFSGDWIVTEPPKHLGGQPSRFVAEAASFAAWYIPTDQENTYFARQLLRIAPNPLSTYIQSTSYWGSDQLGAPDCYICGIINLGDGTEAAPTQRFLMTAQEFHSDYKPVEEVFGPDWRDKF